ncbi:MAG: dTMP kinase [Actinomycetota bacterium]
MQQPSEGADLRVLTTTRQGSYLTLLRNGTFLRFFLAQGISSLGDWVGVFAIAIYADDLGGSGGVGAVMAARVLPGFLVGPLAGVLADRWDRKKTMVVADISRALIVFSLPFVPNLLYLLMASALLESLTLIWGPAKDASLPNFVSPGELTHANSLSLIAIYGPWPLASIFYALLSSLGGFLGARVPALTGLEENPQALALWLDSLTFAFSALMISTLVIPASRRRLGKLDLAEAKRDLVEGLTFVRDHRQVRPWLLGIAGTFMAAGGVFSLGVSFSRDVLGAGDKGFAIIVGAFGTGMIVGLLAAALLARFIKRDVLFSSSVLLLGFGLLALASVGNLNAAVPIAATLGFFAGAGYSTGYALIQMTTEDEMRGRTFSAAYTIIRIGTLVGLSLFPSVAGLLGDHMLGDYEVPGSRATLWIAGLVVFGGGLLSMRAIRAGRVATRAEGSEERRGCFIVFEGGEGAGKTTQMSALVQWLQARGEDVVTTREPGGTDIGERIRAVLLDPEASALSERAEALLYAADRAQHVDEVIKPALDGGSVVVSDRFVDSSLAYQGLARGLGLEQVYEISRWATDGLLPDLVLFLNLEPGRAFGRLVGDRDRIELEDESFHGRVGAAYMELARRFPERFVVVDASRSTSDVHREVVTIVQERIVPSLEGRRTAGARGPGAPIRR